MPPPGGFVFVGPRLNFIISDRSGRETVLALYPGSTESCKSSTVRPLLPCAEYRLLFIV